MITIDNLNTHRKYGGNEDGLTRVGRDNEKALFPNNDCGLIRDYEQNIELIGKGLTSEEFKNRTIQDLRNIADSHLIIELTKSIPKILL